MWNGWPKKWIKLARTKAKTLPLPDYSFTCMALFPHVYYPLFFWLQNFFFGKCWWADSFINVTSSRTFMFLQKLRSERYIINDKIPSTYQRWKSYFVEWRAGGFQYSLKNTFVVLPPSLSSCFISTDILWAYNVLNCWGLESKTM